MNLNHYPSEEGLWESLLNEMIIQLHLHQTLMCGITYLYRFVVALTKFVVKIQN